MDQQQPISKLEQVINLLRIQGHSDQHIKDFVENLTNLAAGYIRDEVFLVMTDEDKDRLDKVHDQETADRMIRKIYLQRTGKDAQEETQRFVDQLCDQVLQGN